MATKATTPAPATAGVFVLGDEHVSALDSLPARGRAATKPMYADAVTEAITTGDRKGIKITGTDVEKDARKARNQLTKAANYLTKELDKVKGNTKYVKISSRLVENHPKLGSFIAFTAEHKERENTETPTS